MLSCLKSYKAFFVLAVIIMFFGSFLEVFQIGLFVPLVDVMFTQNKIQIPNQNLPAVVYNLVDYLNSLDPKTSFIPFLAFVMLMILFKNFLVWSYSLVMSEISQRVMRDIRYRLYQKIQNLSLDYFSEKRTGELVSRITYDANLIENAVSYGLIDLIRQPFVIIYPFGAMIIFFLFPFLGIPITSIGKKLKKISQGTQEKMADINAHLLETISGIKLVKAFCMEESEVQRFHSQNFQLYKLKMKSVKRLILISPITELFACVCAIAIIWLLGQRVMARELSFGVFSLFLGSIMTIISPIKKLGNANALIQQALSAHERIYEVLDQKATVCEPDQPKELEELQTSIVLKDIHFEYSQESGIVLDNVNLEVKKGELVAIVGPTGTGKSTLVNLIPRFYDPSQGEVIFDGVNVNQVSFKSLRDQMGIVTQETILFNDTVKANICYGCPDASQEEMESAAKRAYAHDFIMKMPEQYKTIIGDRGFRLSGGEKQRIAIARAILKNPPILILDEATSQLDSASEQIVQEALDKLMKGRTVVAIAHRLSTVIKADKIVVIDLGKIVGIDKHSQLLKNCPLYKKLHSVQFQM